MGHSADVPANVQPFPGQPLLAPPRHLLSAFNPVAVFLLLFLY